MWNFLKYTVIGVVIEKAVDGMSGTVLGKWWTNLTDSAKAYFGFDTSTDDLVEQEIILAANVHQTIAYIVLARKWGLELAISLSKAGLVDPEVVVYASLAAALEQGTMQAGYSADEREAAFSAAFDDQGAYASKLTKNRMRNVVLLEAVDRKRISFTD